MPILSFIGFTCRLEKGRMASDRSQNADELQDADARSHAAKRAHPRRQLRAETRSSQFFSTARSQSEASQHCIAALAYVAVEVHH